MSFIAAGISVGRLRSTLWLPGIGGVAAEADDEIRSAGLLQLGGLRYLPSRRRYRSRYGSGTV